MRAAGRAQAATAEHEGHNGGGEAPLPTPGGRSRGIRRVLAVVVLAVLAADVATVMVRRSALTRVTAAASPSTPHPRPLFHDDFSGSTVFRPDEDENGSATLGDGRLRVRFKGHDGFISHTDSYRWVPTEVPASTLIEQTADLSVAVDAQDLGGAPDNVFGVFCRSQGLDHDLYSAAFTRNGLWTIYRATLGTSQGSGYGKRALASGRTPGVEGPQPAEFVFRIRLDCTGLPSTTLRLFVDNQEVGGATDPSGLPPGKAGILAGSTEGELAFDNLVVSALD